MAISKTTIESRLRPFLIARLEPSVIDALSASVLLGEFNQVAHDLNERAQVNIERIQMKANTDNSEDSNRLNYLVSGVILDVVYFRVEDSDWETQYYTYSQDRFAFKNAPKDGAEMDFRYLRQCEDLVAGSDEIDLPRVVENDYLSLLKQKLLIDYGPETPGSYEEALTYYAANAQLKVSSKAFPNTGLVTRWFHQTGDLSVYVITHNYISPANFVTDVNGNLTHKDFNG